MAPVENETRDSRTGGRDGGNGRGERRSSHTRFVRYGAMRWVGEFSTKQSRPLSDGTSVVLQTERGIELGECIGPPQDASREPFCEQVRAFLDNSGPEFCRTRAGRILRVANEQDLNEQRHLNAHIREDIDHCASLAHRLDLDLKVVTAEHLLGGERIVFYFRAPARVDFRQLVKELAQRHRTRIEMRQVGARDEARLVADYEICGRECCCKNFLKKLRPVNMKMAKLQKSTLDPSKVSGRCGRLRCCLRYEHEGYDELMRRLPRTGSRVDTEFGPATVIDRQVLTQLLLLRTDDQRVMTIPLEEIKAFDLPPAPPKERPSPTTTPSAAGAEESALSSRRGRRRTGRRGPRSTAEPERGPRPAAEEKPEAEASKSRFKPGGAGEPGAGADAERPSADDGGAARGSRKRPPRRRRRRRSKGRGSSGTSGAGGTDAS
jgi:cell fate regulator YaaT (PSP1 superfamily)